jgi:hypothetical protein
VVGLGSNGTGMWWKGADPEGERGAYIARRLAALGHPANIRIASYSPFREDYMYPSQERW